MMSKNEGLIHFRLKYLRAYSPLSRKERRGILNFTVIWKEQAVWVVGAASSRDHFISRLEAAPTGVIDGKRHHF